MKNDMKDYKKVFLTPKLNIIIRKKTVSSDLAEFLHGACFAPVLSTWIIAIQNNHFLTWPGRTEKLVRKYLFPSLVTAQGHLHQERKHLQSTKSYDQRIKT